MLGEAQAGLAQLEERLSKVLPYLTNNAKESVKISAGHTHTHTTAEKKCEQKNATPYKKGAGRGAGRRCAARGAAGQGAPLFNEV